MSSENLYESKEILEEYTTLKRKTRVELKKISKLEVAKKCFQALCSRQLSFSDWFPFRGKNTFDRVGVGKKLCFVPIPHFQTKQHGVCFEGHKK